MYFKDNSDPVFVLWQKANTHTYTVDELQVENRATLGDRLPFCLQGI